MNQQHALFSINFFFNRKLLHVSIRVPAHHQKDQLCVNSNWYSHALCWLYQLLFIQSWSCWWWASSLLETRRDLLL